MFPLEKLPAVKATPQHYRLHTHLSALPWPGITEGVKTKVPFLIIDVETTGKNHGVDGVTELGLVYGEYCKDTLRITNFGAPQSWYNDPGIPIPEKIQKLTKITDEMVRGHKLPLREIDRFLDQKPLVIAHFAPFDRPFVESVAPAFAKLPWACSCTEIDWFELGYEGGNKLKYLATDHGFYYDAHRAGIDCQALAQILTLNQPAFAELVGNARKPSFLVEAFDTPFETKDSLSDRGYRWRAAAPGVKKCWWRCVPGDDIEDEKAFLNSLPGYRHSKAGLMLQTAFTRFKAVK